MNVQQLIVLLPCHSLEDFPQHHRGEEAAGLLAAWTALWHPALLAAANRAPLWYRASDPPTNTEHSVLVVPTVCTRDVPPDFIDRVSRESVCLITGVSDRRELLDRMLSVLDESQRDLDSDLAQDFLALGYAFLQIQVLTRQMRYSSSLDEVNFNQHLLAAARAAVARNDEEARSKLSACFGLLSSERDHFYAVEAFLLDLTLVAPTTLGPALRSELLGPSPVNLVLTGELLTQISALQGGTLEALQAALASGLASVVGVEQHERCTSLLSCETILGELRRGLATCESLLGYRPSVYARRRFGLTPVMPQILDRLGYRGACHVALDDARFPQSSHMKTRWEGADGIAIDALGKTPLDAGKPETFLSLGTKLGESMDMDTVATVWLAHWPGAAHYAYDDLRRCAKYGTAMGRFKTMDAYFRDTYASGHIDRFDADQYRSPYLVQAVGRQSVAPISSVANYWRARTVIEQVRALDAMLAALGTSAGNDPGELESQVDDAADEGLDPGVSERIDCELQARLQRFAAALPKAAGASDAGCLVVNPRSFARRVAVELPGLARPPVVGRPIYAADGSGGTPHATVDVPSMGFVWVGPGSSRATSASGPRLAEDRSQDEGICLLRNEYFEARISTTTGSLVSIKHYDSRTNRMSQQIAYRAAGAHSRLSYTDVAEKAEYSTMVADKVCVLRSTLAIGEVETAGRLVDRHGSRLADFRQVYRLARGRRLVEIEIELNPVVEPTAEPWRSYYACRFAWPDEAAELDRSLSQTRRKAGAHRIEAPHYIDIRSGDLRTSILAGGLPYHRRVGSRMIDTMLIVHGERERKFRLGIGVDLPHPLQEAIGLLSPPCVLPMESAPGVATGWFFHLDAKNVAATHWSPLVEGGQVRGIRARILETAGRSARAKLSCCRELVRARYVNFQGNSLGDCSIDSGRAVLDVTAHQWVEVEAFWN